MACACDEPGMVVPAVQFQGSLSLCIVSADSRHWVALDTLWGSKRSGGLPLFSQGLALCGAEPNASIIL